MTTSLWFFLPEGFAFSDSHLLGKIFVVKELIDEEGIWGTGSLFSVPEIVIRITSIY